MEATEFGKTLAHDTGKSCTVTSIIFCPSTAYYCGLWNKLCLRRGRDVLP